MEIFIYTLAILLIIKFILIPSIVTQTYKTKIKKLTFPIILFFVSTSAQAAYSKLAKDAGVSHYTMKKIVKKIVKIESITGKYTAKNRNSGAYGRYQVLPSTAKFYAKKLKIPYRQWKKPYNQDKIFKAIMKDNIRSLKRNGHKVTAFSIYGSHQQGAGGFNTIMKKKKLSKTLERNLRHNLPKKYKYSSGAKLRNAWLKYWKNKFA